MKTWKTKYDTYFFFFYNSYSQKSQILILFFKQINSYHKKTWSTKLLWLNNEHSPIPWWNNDLSIGKRTSLGFSCYQTEKQLDFLLDNLLVRIMQTFCAFFYSFLKFFLWLNVDAQNICICINSRAISSFCI